MVAEVTAVASPVPDTNRAAVVNLPTVAMPIASAKSHPLAGRSLRAVVHLTSNATLLVSAEKTISKSQCLLSRSRVAINHSPETSVLLSSSAISHTRTIFHESSNECSIVSTNDLGNACIGHRHISRRRLGGNSRVVLNGFHLICFSGGTIVTN